jgi:hypothetical protein
MFFASLRLIRLLVAVALAKAEALAGTMRLKN